MSTEKPSEPVAAGHNVTPDNQFQDGEPETVEEAAAPTSSTGSTGTVKPNNQFQDSAPKG
ncbi:hypothetical protein [Actinacidiphila guanduensis]|uniref:Uncharacterized protein n=1 Tax=Actinacidiphila guanduensis TaxID=310781 RepID=A0A1H0F7U0_9ACTN|nr:hypothetical protein [Actinacidiphila guanduensis]SDN90622.1 hypothetical protein SAMN05216259_106187 [Actinacidiphila guanduensis]